MQPRHQQGVASQHCGDLINMLAGVVRAASGEAPAKRTTVTTSSATPLLSVKHRPTTTDRPLPLHLAQPHCLILDGDVAYHIHATRMVQTSTAGRITEFTY
jgi:hypothetical protein